MNDFNPPVTPKIIVEEGWRFSIPIYQRLFVWESEQIDRLLEDLWKANNPKTNPYYVGVITTVEQEDGKNGRVFSVVDGQQRLTFLLLFFCECAARIVDNEIAKKFVLVESRNALVENLRIRFIGRDEDEFDMQHYLAKDWDKVKNSNFRQFHDRMEIFIKKHEDWENKKDDFIKYVYENTSFLANELVGYSNADLNLYFEKMNSTGRQLSPLDQLKGSFAKDASEWNDCFNFEKFRKRDGIPGAEDGKPTSVQQDIQKEDDIDIDKIVKWREKVSEEPSPNQESASFARLPMRPEVLALHALRLTLEGNENWKVMANEIDYSPRHLLDSFNNVFKATVNSRKEFAEAYMGTLQAYRDWIDCNIIYLHGEMETDEEEVGNFLGLKYAFREAASHQDPKMLRLQSMLYVSSGEAQKWVLDAYEDYKKNTSGTAETLFDFLKQWAVKRLPEDPNKLVYNPGMDRVAFWTLDYLLWESVWSVSCPKGKVADVLFPNGVMIKLSWDQIEAIKSYHFAQNRSVEHLHPQNPVNESDEWENDRNVNKDVVRNCFGNLCMISQSANSGLSNEPVDVKFAKIRYALQGHTLQSIKLLLMFEACGGEDSKWTPEIAIEHGENMLRILGFNSDAINWWKQKLQLGSAKE